MADRPGRRKLTPEQERQLCEQYAAGVPCVEIGRRFGVHPKGFGPVLKRNGYERRTPFGRRVSA